MKQFGEVLPFIQNRRQGHQREATLRQTEEILTDAQTMALLKIELAAVVDAGKSMAESTYMLEQMVPLYRNSMSSCHLPKTVLTQPIFLMRLYSGIQRNFGWQSTCSAAVARSRTANYSTWMELVPTNYTRNCASSNGNVHGQRGCQPLQDFPITPCCK